MQQPLKRRLRIVSLLAAALAFACDGSSPTDPDGGGGGGPGPVIGSGNIVTVSRSVSGFSGVFFEGAHQLSIEETGFESLTITGDDNLLPLLRSEVIAGELFLRLRDGIAIATTAPIVYRLTVTELDAISVSRGPAQVEAIGIETSSLTSNLSSVSSTSISGRADQQTINISDQASYDAAGLQSREVTIDAAGGRATVRVSERLEVTFVSSSAIVEYFGDPTVTVSGNGLVRRLGD